MQLALGAGLYIAMFLLMSEVNGRLEAYLDPGTGSMVIQAVLAAIVGAASLVRLYWHRLKSVFGRAHKDDNALIGD